MFYVTTPRFFEILRLQVGSDRFIPGTTPNTNSVGDNLDQCI